MLKDSVIKRLEEIVGKENVKTSKEELLTYSYDATVPEFMPDAVVFPETAEEISRILKLANAEKFSVVPRGAGTNLSGGVLPLEGGVVLSTARMNRILEIDTDNLVAVVQPGVITAELDAAVGEHGLFYPPDPASGTVSTLGGNIAECSGGPRCLKYGVTRDYVLGLQVVLPTGEIVRTGGRTVKNTTGYDFTRLFIGSEGTIGIVTEITVRLLPKPEAKKTMLAIYDDVVDASQTVSAIIAHGIIPTTLELMDNLLIQCAEDYTHAGLPKDAGALLLIEVDGFRESLDRQVGTILELCEKNNAKEVRMAKDEKEVAILWKARKTVIGAVARVRPSYSLQDITVPRNRLPDIVARIVEISKKYDLPIGVLAHAGDGNLHPLVMFDKRKEEEVERVHAAEEEMCRAALEMGGTLTGEHGVGYVKRTFLTWAYSKDELEMTRRLKEFFDPNGILNPGKIVKWDASRGEQE